MVVFNFRYIPFSFREIFSIIKIAVVGWDAVEITHVFGIQHFFAGAEGFVELFSVAGSNNLYRYFLAGKFYEGLRQIPNFSGRRFIDEPVSRIGIFKRK